MNNCIGHFNHRYFYLTMVYIVGGCIFLMILGAPIAYRQIILDEDVIPFSYESSSDSDFNKEIVFASKFQDSSESEGFRILASTYSWKNLFSYFKSNSSPSPTLDSRVIGQGQVLFGIIVSKTLVLTMIYFVALLIIGKCEVHFHYRGHITPLAYTNFLFRKKKTTKAEIMNHFVTVRCCACPWRPLFLAWEINC